MKADKLTTYTKTESDAKITALVNAAPATLDTLKEIATALGNDANLAATLTTAIGTKAAKTDVTASLLLKADNTVIDGLVIMIGLKAVASTVTAALKFKSDVSSVEWLITHIQETYYTITAAATALGYKANSTDVFFN